MKILTLVTASALILAQPFFAQDPASTTTLVPSNDAIGQLQPADVTAPAQLTEDPLSRWLELNALSFSFRYRDEATTDGSHVFENGQERSLIDGRVKLDASGKYAVHFRVSSGKTFNWAYTDEIGLDYRERIPGASAYSSPAFLQTLYAAAAADPAGYAAGVNGSPSRGWEMYFRQLYFSAAPIKQISLEYGSLGIERGEGSEATTYDDDGYIAGERIRLLDPKHLFFDQVVATYAYEGDIYQVNFFDRAERLGQSNYHQFLAEKHFGSRIKTSYDYTFDKGTHTIRQAVVAKVPEVRALDSVRLELYQRVNDKVLQGETFYAHSGFAVTGTKTFFRKFQLDGGFAKIDQDYGVLTGDRLLALVGFSMNGDSFLTGNRVFARANWKVTSYVNLFGYYSHQVTTVPSNVLELNKQGLNGGATIDFKNILAKCHVLQP